MEEKYLLFSISTGEIFVLKQIPTEIEKILK